MDRAKLLELVEASDSDGLIRFVDGICAARNWGALAEVRGRCVEAESRGRQLFGIVQFVDYRQALEAPPELAAAVLADGAGRFALGPLWEVAASTHTWAELAPHIESPRMRALVGAERVLRGETVTDELDVELLGTPFEVFSWEPPYRLADYKSDRADFPGADPVAFSPLPTAESAPADDRDSEDALFGLIRVWVEESNGIAHVITVEGTAAGAVAAIALEKNSGAQVSFTDALAHMAWAGANGGAYGSRRGGAVGRSAAWAAAAAVADLEWPADPVDFLEAGTRLNWWLWEPKGRIGGWHLGVAVEDEADGLAWAISGRDELNDEASPDTPS